MLKEGDRGPPNVDEEPVDCVICVEPCMAVCIFECGHFTCFTCGLRIQTINKGSCPICRVSSKQVVVTRALSACPEQYTAEEMASAKKLSIFDRKLQCFIDGNDLAAEVAKLYENVCPMPACWFQGFQDPFIQFNMLKDHLKTDHAMSYCEICLQNRPTFLCEEIAYSEKALQQHLEGRCALDSTSFSGHPPCRFCKRTRFYDGEMLLKHMQQAHFTCDVCNRGQFTFTFYENRNKLNLHFERAHFICDHPDCAHLDVMMRVFATEIDLAAHKQRVHGVKAKVSFACGEVVSDVRGGVADNLSRGPATGANTNAIQIVFDHVHHKETVEMMPLKGGRGKRGHDHKKDDLLGHVPQGSGLPRCFRKKNVLTPLMRAAEPAVSPSSPVSTTLSQGNDGATRGFGNASGNNMKNNRGGNNTSRGGWTPSFDNKGVPDSVAERHRMLDRILERELKSPVLYGQFRSVTREFLDSKILTLEYYNLVAHTFFPNPDTFNEIFPLLCSTIPSENKQKALEAVWRMKTAPEVQRMEQSRQEDEKARLAKEQEDQALNERSRNERTRLEEQQRLFGHHLVKGNAKGSGSNKQAKNAWHSSNGTAKIVKNAWGSDTTSSSSPQPEPSFQQQQSPSSNEFPTLSAVYAGSPTISDPSLYPSLPSTGGRRGLPASKKASKKANAWFK